MMVRMDITPYVESLRRDLVAAAETGSEETRAAAERLALSLEPSTRLALMEAISQAASEITAEMRAGSVDVRLSGRELRFVIEEPGTPAPSSPTPPTDEVDEDGAVARVTLRIPESVKARAEELAAKAGTSLNTWLVTAVRAATTADQSVRVDVDLSSIPFLGGDPFDRGGHRGNRRMSGWV
jgi:hypothetical protein